MSSSDTVQWTLPKSEQIVLAFKVFIDAVVIEIMQNMDLQKQQRML